MSIASFRALVTATFFSNGNGGIDGTELQAALLEVAGLLEAQTSWTPTLTTVADGSRIVVKITDWTGGVGVKPAINVYLSSSGLTATLSSATDIKGATGSTGAAGTASATSQLNVSASNPTSGILAVLTNTASSAWNGVKIAFNKMGIGIWQIGMPAGSDDAFVILGFGGGAIPEYLRIDSVGNTGIGTSVPLERLDVNGNVNVRGVVRMPTTVANRKIVLYQDNSAFSAGNDNQFYGLGVNGGVLRYQVISNSDAHVFYAGLTSTTSTELARIQGDGKMGLGTASPSEKLDVDGRIRSKGLITTGTIPTIIKGAGVSTGTAAILANSTDMCGDITLTTSGSPTTNAPLCTVTFNVAYARPPRVILTGKDAQGANAMSRIGYTSTANGFTLNSGAVAIDNGISLTVTYLIIA